MSSLYPLSPTHKKVIKRPALNRRRHIPLYNPPSPSSLENPRHPSTRSVAIYRESGFVATTKAPNKNTELTGDDQNKQLFPNSLSPPATVYERGHVSDIRNRPLPRSLRGSGSKLYVLDDLGIFLLFIDRVYKSIYEGGGLKDTI